MHQHDDDRSVTSGDGAAATATGATTGPRQQDSAALNWLPTVERCLIAFVSLTIALLVMGWIGRLVIFDSVIGDAESDLVGWLADNRIGIIDTLMTVGSTLTDTWTVIGVLFGAVAMLLATGTGRYAGVMLIAMGLEVSVFVVVGEIIDRTRPDVDVLHSLPSTPSFPSGHVAAAVVLFGSLTRIARALTSGHSSATVWIAPALAAMIVASSRIYEGVHYPSDVIGGLLLGLGALYGAAYASEPFAPEALAPPVPALPGRSRQTESEQT